MENTRELFQIMTRRLGFLNKNCCSTGEYTISLIQSHILYEIDQQHQPSMQEIAETLGVDITTFSRQIQTLMKMDLVKKSPAIEDRRIQILSLTTEGKFVATSIDNLTNDNYNEIFSHMDESEKEIVLRSVKLLNQAMEKSSMCCTPIG